MEQRGEGPDVLLVAGLGDPAEAWQPQLEGFADRYRLTAFDNRGAGRSPLPDGPLSVARMADDAVPGAVFEVLPGEAHQPFQEVPEVFNARVGAFWREVEARADGRAVRHR